MSLIKRSFPSFSSFNDLFDDGHIRSRLSGENWLPAINISDNEGNYEIELAAPGYKKEDFKVSVENRMLIISGESKSTQEDEGKNYTRKEFHSSSFTRSFTLPENVSDEQIQAEYKDGVLRLKLGKKLLEKAEQKSIEVN